jgi:hypothetical protein
MRSQDRRDQRISVEGGNQFDLTGAGQRDGPAGPDRDAEGVGILAVQPGTAGDLIGRVLPAQVQVPQARRVRGRLNVS